MNQYVIRNVLLSLSLLWFISACDGGLVGTSTGPHHGSGNGSGQPVAEVPGLPKKISPYLPDSIRKKPDLSYSNAQQLNDTQLERTSVQTQPESKSWSMFSTSLQEADSTRIAVQEILALLDTEFDSIVEACAAILLKNTPCEIEGGEIKAVYNSDITRQMISVHTTANADAAVSNIMENTTTSELRTHYTLLEGSSVAFNTLTLIAPVNDADHYTLITSTQDLLPNHDLRLSWNSTYDQITYEVRNTTFNNELDRYHYRNSHSGQRLTIQRDQLGEDGDLNTESFELTTSNIDNDEVYYSARINRYHITGQATADKALSYNRFYDDENDYYFHELFDGDGYLYEFDDCSGFFDFFCEDWDLDDEYYGYKVSPHDLELAFLEFGFIELSITGLPADVEDFLIVENDPGIPLWLREELCIGWQPQVGEIELFCFVPEFELDNAVIVSADGDELVLLPEADITWDN